MQNPFQIGFADGILHDSTVILTVSAASASTCSEQLQTRHIIKNPMFTPRQHCAASVVDGDFSYRKASFPYDKNAPRGCALPARGRWLPRQPRSARECQAHILFYVTERDKAFWYQLVKHLSEAASLIRMEFSKWAWYTQLNKIKVRNRIGAGGVKISRNHNRAGILESCIK